MMRIAIDARAFHWTGVGRYIRNLVTALAAKRLEGEYTLLVPERQEDAIARELNDTDRFFRYVGVEPSYYSFKEQTRFVSQLDALDVDLVHFTHFNVPYLYTKPYVVTIHDITRFIFPGQKRQSLLQQLAYETIFAHAASAARHVITVSNTTMKDMKMLPFRHLAPMTTIYEGVDDDFRKPILPLAKQKARLLVGTDRPFLLFVGVWMSHKNLLRLMAAYENVRAKHPEVALVITGKPVPGYSNLIQYVRKHNLEKDVIFPGFAPHALLPALYAEATALVFPSLYEGFGLPPLEAMMCGTPVVASNVSSIPELLKDNAEYVNPESVDDIARGMLKIIEDTAYANKLAAQGIPHAQQFSWDTAAAQHVEVYKKAI